MNALFRETLLAAIGLTELDMPLPSGQTPDLQPHENSPAQSGKCYLQLGWPDQTMLEYKTASGIKLQLGTQTTAFTIA